MILIDMNYYTKIVIVNCNNLKYLNKIKKINQKIYLKELRLKNQH